MLMALLVAVGPVFKVQAASGDTMSNPVIASFGSSYTASWTKDTDHLNHYVKITVPQNGVVTLRASKPYDIDEYASLHVTCYTASGDIVWGTECYHVKESPLDYYLWNVGVKAGDYVFTIKPGFYVESGLISTNYSFSFQANEYAEKEPNESIGQATQMQLGHMYQGYYGQEGFYNAEEFDCWRVYLEQGKRYRLAVGNWEKKASTSTIFDFLDPNGGTSTVFYRLGNAVDANGNTYVDFTAETTGNYAAKFRNYNGAQYAYTIGVFQLDGSGNPMVSIDAGPEGSMYRLYNPNSGEHFYTANIVETNNLVAAGWRYEAIAWIAPTSSNTPVYRVYNPNSGEHHYTIDAIEKNYLISLGWNNEGIGWYSDDNQGTPLYRLYNPFASGQYEAGAHHYTKDVNEKNNLIAAGWRDEGIGWYGI